METVSSLIKSFSVYGLFRTHDVHIPFDENIKILIGENGLGKTQVLNMFYYTLCGKFERLIDFSFDKVELEFLDSDPISISKSEIEQDLSSNSDVINWRHPDVVDLINRIGKEQFKQFIGLQKEFVNKNFSRLSLGLHPIGRRIIRESGYSDRKLLSILLRFSDEDGYTFSDNLQQSREIITEKLDQYQIMYFPTYRRIEEDLKNFGYDEEEFNKEDNQLIHFGMDDVCEHFEQIEKNMDQLLKAGFSEISSAILSQLIKGVSNTDTSILNRIDEKDIDIILARVGEQLSEEDKKEIREIVISQEIKNDSLLYFLQKLIEIYEKQKPLDDFIKVYRDICNKYLISKKVFYDESAIRIFVKSDISDEEIELSQLSSGEKQIISIFSKIYLAEDRQKFIVLFDEPELSLSIFWQRELLPDIINSGKCNFLLAATHSPFIFENELERYAIGLNEFIQPIKSLTHS